MSRKEASITTGASSPKHRLPRISPVQAGVAELQWGMTEAFLVHLESLPGAWDSYDFIIKTVHQCQCVFMPIAGCNKQQAVSGISCDGRKINNKIKTKGKQ